jgi:hypothetical protein
MGRVGGLRVCKLTLLAVPYKVISLYVTIGKLCGIVSSASRSGQVGGTY